MNSAVSNSRLDSFDPSFDHLHDCWHTDSDCRIRPVHDPKFVDLLQRITTTATGILIASDLLGYCSFLSHNENLLIYKTSIPLHIDKEFRKINLYKNK